MLSDVLALFFPPVCTACKRGLKFEEKYFCLQCRVTLPAVNDRLRMQLDHKFRFVLKECLVLWKFTDYGRARNIIHTIKYRAHKDLALECGKLLGHRLINSDIMQDVVLIPVPQHPIRRFSRGFNQAAAIASGIAQVTNMPVYEPLRRTGSLTSQTTRNRRGRLRELEKSIEKIPGSSIPSRVMIVDDVVTTGATIQTCADILLQGGVEEISIAAIATV